MLLSQQLPPSISHTSLQYIKCQSHFGKMMKASMENQFNFHQSILSHPSPSETETTTEIATGPSRTPDLSRSPLYTPKKNIMGKCLSVCKERKNPLLGENESPADAPSPSPDRNDPPKILTSTSRSLAHINRTNSAIGGVQALTDDAKHVGHIGLTFISLSPIDHRKTGQGEQSWKLEANKAQESDCGENEHQGNATPAASGSEACKPEENGADHHQQTKVPSSGDAVNNTSHVRHSAEEGISSQNAAYNHRSSDANLQTAESQENRGSYQSSPEVHPNPLNENGMTRGLQNEEGHMNEAATLVPALSDVSSQWITLCPALERKEGFPFRKIPESVRERSTMRHGLRRLFEISPHNICVATGDANVIEIDILCPGVLDGPPMQLAVPLNPQHPKSLMELSNCAIQVLRLSRLQSCKSFDLDRFLYVFAKNSSALKELVLEDAGQISKGTAKFLADIKCLEKLEVYDPKVPLLRAFTIGCTELKELCLHGLTTDVERDVCLYLHQKGASLHSLSLNFSLSVRKGEWTEEQEKFFGRMLTFLDCALTEVLSDLLILEVSSCPSYEVKHSFDAIDSATSSRTEQLALYHVDTMVRKKQCIVHSKASMISLRKIKLRGHFSAIRDTLEVLSWVNQDKMEIKVELPGVSAIYPRGFGMMKPVVLTFLQLDKFISQTLMFPWLELTALREIDIGEMEFVRKYNADTESVQTETRKLLVTSRESLSRVRVCYKMPTRDICLETRKILGQIVLLTPLVNHLDISRDVVLHANVGDYEYMETIMLLRRWDMKTVQLVTSQNYGTIETGNAETESDPISNVKKDMTEEFIRKLPAFLTILAGACPKLENLVVESEEICSGWKECEERARLIEDGMKALEVFERVVPTVKVGTLRGQLQAWESLPDTDE